MPENTNATNLRLINPKFDYRNTKQIQMTKIQMTKTKTMLAIPRYTERIAFVLNFKFLDFEFVSCFVLRIYFRFVFFGEGYLVIFDTRQKSHKIGKNVMEILNARRIFIVWV